MSGLVISRAIGEGVWIDEHTRVSVDRISGNRVKLRIEAPEDVNIARDELTDRGEDRE